MQHKKQLVEKMRAEQNAVAEAGEVGASAPTACSSVMQQPCTGSSYMPIMFCSFLLTGCTMLPCRKLAHKTGFSSCCARQRSSSTLLLQAPWRRQRRSRSSGRSLVMASLSLFSDCRCKRCTTVAAVCCQSCQQTPSTSGSQHTQWLVQDSMQEPSTRQCRCYAPQHSASLMPAPSSTNICAPENNM